LDTEISGNGAAPTDKRSMAADAMLDATPGRDRLPAAADAPPLSPAVVDARPPALDLGAVTIAIHESLDAIESDWRAFERQADGTVFQSFDWLACWQRHIGERDGATPAIVVGRDATGAIQFILPLAVQAGRLTRELTWLGSDLCDYNAPLLAPGFGARIDRSGFLSLWRVISERLQSNPCLQFDLVRLTKMPDKVGTQNNPMLYLAVAANPSGAYLTHLAGDWDTFYAAKRSSSTRRRDRTKRKRLSEIGEVILVNPEGKSDILRTLDTLMMQKARSFARMGVGDMFARPGYAEFYRALATDPATRHFVHVSSLNVGATAAAINLGLTWHGCYYHLLASYDDGEVSRFGPGAAHLHDLMRWAIEHGLSVFDFTIGDEPYKRDWCDTEVRLYDFIAGATRRGALVAAVMVAAARLKRWIKQTPIVWALFSKVREIVGWLRRLAGVVLKS
jgi:CelD/BcsL family acetyltransferase involved in cellulose biosynthesis